MKYTNDMLLGIIIDNTIILIIWVLIVDII
jgi:hypothetical protein